MSYVDNRLERRIEVLDKLIETAQQSIIFARRKNALLLLEGAQKELSFALYEKDKALKELMGSRV